MHDAIGQQHSLAQRLQGTLHLLQQRLIQLCLCPPGVGTIAQQQLQVGDAVQLVLQLRVGIVAGLGPGIHITCLALQWAQQQKSAVSATYPLKTFCCWWVLVEWHHMG